MRKKILCCLLVMLCMVMLFSACDGASEQEAPLTVNADGKPYISTLHSDNSYTFADSKGTILFEHAYVRFLPDEIPLTDRVYEITHQAGTGLSTNWAFFYDAEKEVISEIYHYVLGSDGEYVVCGELQDGQWLIAVYNIFDPASYSKTYVLENISPVAADFSTGCEFQADGSAVVTYLTGEDYEEVALTVEIP